MGDCFGGLVNLQLRRACRQAGIKNYEFFERFCLKCHNTRLDPNFYGEIRKVTIQDLTPISISFDC